MVKVPFSLRLSPETLDALNKQSTDELKARALAEAILDQAATDGTAAKVAEAKKKGQPR